MNLYGYVGNDPVNGRDPFGLSEENDECPGGQPRNPAGACPPVPAGVGRICYASRINVAPGSGCGGSYYDSSYYFSYYDYLQALVDRPRNIKDALAVVELEGLLRIDPHASLAAADGDSSGMEGKGSWGYRLSIFAGGVGGTASVRTGADANFNQCFVVEVCGRIGAGGAIGVTNVVSFGQGNFTEGNSLNLGLFGNFGYGPFGSTSLNINWEAGHISVSGGLGGGVGAAA